MDVTESLSAVQVREVFTVFARLVHEHAPLLDRINAFPVPDADTGRNLASTMAAAVAAAELIPVEAGLGPFCRALADGVFDSARGNSGTILAQLLGGFLEVAEQAVALDAIVLCAALDRAAQVGPLAVAEVAPGSMLTVARDVAAATARLGTETLTTILVTMFEVGRTALARTRELNPVLTAANVVDAGAAGFLLFGDALLHVATGKRLPTPETSGFAATVDAQAEPIAHGGAPEPSAEGAGAEGGAPPAFEVMFIMADVTVDRSDLVALLSGVGDSVVVAGRDGHWTCHVHTDDIGAVLEAMLAHGAPSKVRVEILDDAACASGRNG